MAYVRGHYRRDGSYVRPHYRRTRRSAPPSPRPVTYSRGVSSTSYRSRSVPGGPTTYVRGHYRNGFYVRPHHRRISPSVVVAAGGGFGAFLLILLLLVVLGGGSNDSKDRRPGKAPSAPSSSHAHHQLSR